MKPKGWHGEGQRHAMASRGVSTKHILTRGELRKSKDWHELDQENRKKVLDEAFGTDQYPWFALGMNPGDFNQEQWELISDVLVRWFGAGGIKERHRDTERLLKQAKKEQDQFEELRTKRKEIEEKSQEEQMKIKGQIDELERTIINLEQKIMDNDIQDFELLPKGIGIKYWEWRSSKWLTGYIDGPVFTGEDSAGYRTIEFPIKTKPQFGEEHYIEWDPIKRRWESGEL